MVISVLLHPVSMRAEVLVLVASFSGAGIIERKGKGCIKQQDAFHRTSSDLAHSLHQKMAELREKSDLFLPWVESHIRERNSFFVWSLYLALGWIFLL